MDIERLKSDSVNFSDIGEIIEEFFTSVHHKIVQNNLYLNKHVIVEDIEGL